MKIVTLIKNFGSQSTEKEKKKKENRKMSEFKKIMNELKIEKEFCISVNWLEKAQKINSQMVQLIYENTQKMKLGIL